MRFLIVFLSILFLLNLAHASEVKIEKIPFYPAEDNQCGPASLAMVLNFFGINVNPSEISREIFSREAKGTSDFDMILYARKSGLKVKQYNGNLEDLEKKISKGYPIIVMVDEGFWFYRKYHYMVVVGYNEREIIVNSGKYQNLHVDKKTFIKKWEKTNFWTLYIYREEENGAS